MEAHAAARKNVIKDKDWQIWDRGDLSTSLELVASYLKAVSYEINTSIDSRDGDDKVNISAATNKISCCQHGGIPRLQKVATEKWNTSEKRSKGTWEIIDANSRFKNKTRTIYINLVISCKCSDRLEIWTQCHKRRVVRNSRHCIILTACKSWCWKVVKSRNDYSSCWRNIWIHSWRTGRTDDTLCGITEEIFAPPHPRAKK